MLVPHTMGSTRELPGVHCRTHWPPKAPPASITTLGDRIAVPARRCTAVYTTATCIHQVSLKGAEKPKRGRDCLKQKKCGIFKHWIENKVEDMVERRVINI